MGITRFLAQSARGGLWSVGYDNQKSISVCCARLTATCSYQDNKGQEDVKKILNTKPENYIHKTINFLEISLLVIS